MKIAVIMLLVIIVLVVGIAFVVDSSVFGLGGQLNW